MRNINAYRARKHYESWLAGWHDAGGQCCNGVIECAWDIAQRVKPDGCSWRGCGELMARLWRTGVKLSCLNSDYYRIY